MTATILDDKESAFVKSLTPQPRGGGRGPRTQETQALAEGKVIFIPGDTSRIVSRYARLGRKGSGMKLRSRRDHRNGVKGVYLWLEPRS